MCGLNLIGFIVQQLGNWLVKINVLEPVGDLGSQGESLVLEPRD